MKLGQAFLDGVRVFDRADSFDGDDMFPVCTDQWVEAGIDSQMADLL